MSETADLEPTGEDVEERGKSRAPLLIAIALFAALGGGGFFATFSGMLALPIGGEEEMAKEADEQASLREEMLGVAYLPLDELVIPLSPKARARLLLFKAEIEVDQADLPAIEAIRPRIMDVFNTYLRVIEERDLEDPSATLRLRAQLLRRVKAVAEPVVPRDVLITAFVLK